MATVSNKPALKIVRQLLSEIRHSTVQKDLKNTPAYQYVISECHKYKTTDEQLCKAREEVKFLAGTYLCYLNSNRKYQEMNIKYAGRGERTVEDTAKMVGFKLPHDPK